MEGDLSCRYSEVRNNVLKCYSDMRETQGIKCDCENKEACSFYESFPSKSEELNEEGVLEKNLHIDKPFFE